jgi:hypothetical protein
MGRHVFSAMAASTLKPDRAKRWAGKLFPTPEEGSSKLIYGVLRRIYQINFRRILIF